ncbi:hypothetical protein [Amycolatopsis sp. NPDC059021]|uniref:hypothetical protein n=1 Tax=Amycolatopsis sp. NPDC059021 TaxID=3346704 RepID=UPI003672C8B0
MTDASAADTMNWTYRSYGSTVDKAVSAVQTLKATFGGTRCTGVTAGGSPVNFGFEAVTQCQIPKFSTENMVYWGFSASGNTVDSAQAAALEIARRSGGPGITMCSAYGQSISVDGGVAMSIRCYVAKIDVNQYLIWSYQGAGTTIDSAMNSAVAFVGSGDRFCTGGGASATTDGNWKTGIQCYTPK